MIARVTVARGVGGRRGRAGERRDAQRLKLPIAALLPEVYGFKVGKRERRRRADLRRRARDRWVRGVLGLCWWAIGRRNHRDPAWRGEGWWSTPEGRARWTEDDRQRKRETRAAARMIGARIVGRDFLIATGPDPLATLLGAP